jgi:hypothetical protein
MTDEQAQSLAKEYNNLSELAERERGKADGSLAQIRYYENKMAAIEEKFWRADVDLRSWL